MIATSDPGSFNRDDLGQTAFEYTAALAVDLGPRASATDQEKAAADFLASEFAGMGYQVEIQPFTVKSLSPGDSSLTLAQPGAPGALGRSSSESISFPVVSISSEDGAKVLEMLSQGEVSATVSVVRKELSSRNVITTKPGPGDAVVVLGAHYDSVPNLPGANDNAAGTAVLLTVAKSLAGRDLPFTVLFIPFGSEELGLRGSRAYLDSISEEEVGRIAAMLNFDVVGTGSEIRLLGSSRLTSLGIDLGQSLKIRVSRSAGMGGSGSDHASFDREGVPVLMFSASNTAITS